MFCPAHRLLLPAVLATAVGLPNSVAAGSPGPPGSNGCPPRTVCDHALGVALTPPPGWQLVGHAANILQ